METLILQYQFYLKDLTYMLSDNVFLVIMLNHRKHCDNIVIRDQKIHLIQSFLMKFTGLVACILFSARDTLCGLLVFRETEFICIIMLELFKQNIC